jgi:hypothetical protein
MTIEIQDISPKAKADRGRWKVLSLMALYLVMAVAVGAARSELGDVHASTAAAALSRPAGSAN